MECYGLAPSTGLSELLNPSAVLQQGNKPIFRTVILVPAQNINDIMVDALNDKWIATNDGVYVLNAQRRPGIDYY